jgi:hypothetical protein
MLQIQSTDFIDGEVAGSLSRTHLHGENIRNRSMSFRIGAHKVLLHIYAFLCVEAFIENILNSLSEKMSLYSAHTS